MPVFSVTEQQLEQEESHILGVRMLGLYLCLCVNVDSVCLLLGTSCFFVYVIVFVFGIIYKVVQVL